MAIDYFLAKINELPLSDPKRSGAKQLFNDLNYGTSEWETCCFLVSYLKDELTSSGEFDNAVLAALGDDIESRFPFLKQMLSGEGDEYRAFSRNAAPYVFLVGDDICYGVLDDFARKFGSAFEKMGYSVIYQDRTKLSKVYMEKYTGGVYYRGIFGMQDPVFATKPDGKHFFFDGVDAPLYFFSFDHPAGFYKEIQDAPQDLIILTLDKYYAAYVKNYFHRRAFFFPPGGEKPQTEYNSFDDFAEKKCREIKYGISFVGSMGVSVQENLDELKKGAGPVYDLVDNFAKRMMAETGKPSDVVFKEMADAGLIDHRQIDDDTYTRLMGEWAAFEKSVSQTFRRKIVKELVSNGVDLEVYGESWKGLGDFQTLHVHDNLPIAEARDVYDRSLMSLNVMTWHKDGFTERVAEAQLNGSLVVTDETKYLRENYTDGQDIILFDLSDESIGRLPKRIKALEAEPEKALHIAYNGYLKASREHTWDTRADQFLKMTL